ncbi:MAG TPA: hypothetical protein VGS41_15575, partial [Chthonomonadales bacterium]|nr:hypothetical protein [Chthonomonadales bacterium]
MNRANKVATRLLTVALLVGIAAASAHAQRGRIPSAPARGPVHVGPRDGRAALNFITGGRQPFASLGPRTFYGPNLSRVPAWTTRRLYDFSKLRTRAPGDQGVPRQTVLLTRQDPSNPFSPATPAQEEHPFWTKDEKYIFFDSDRVSAINGAEGTSFNIYQMTPDGSGINQVLTGSNNKLDPAVSQDGGTLAFVSNGT